jgi:hypothetical protein
MSRVGLVLVMLLGLTACKDEPRRVENDNLGFAATFPGPAKLYRHTDPSPYGDMEWFDTSMSPSGRLDETFSVAIGNLPPGDKGGTTPSQVLATFQNSLRYRFGPIQCRDLPAKQGPGFRYKVKSPNGGMVEGIVVVRQGRLHHAQAIVRRDEDPRTAAFLNDFEVRTR